MFWARSGTYLRKELYSLSKAFDAQDFEIQQSKMTGLYPTHARKMVACLKAQGFANANLYENTEGGHGGAANSTQKAHLNALVYTFLAKSLGLK